MRALLVSLIICAACAFGATDVLVNFTLNTTDIDGNPIRESRNYYVYRPGNLPQSVPAPMVLVMESGPGGPETFFHAQADRSGFILVSCTFSGNSTGTPGNTWTNDNPDFVGYEDYDYITAVINQVRSNYSANDAFVVGLSKGGHMALAYACVRPSMIKAASSLDEFMQLRTNVPTAPVPIIVMQGTADPNIPYTMIEDTVDAWRATDGLSSTMPVTTYESSPLMPGAVSQATWRDADSGLQVAFVTVIGGTHTYPTSGIQTGYDSIAGLWAFFSQFLTSTQDTPGIVSQPVDNIQFNGQPASFRVAATGSGELNYQWQKNGVNIPGATSNWYTEPAPTLSGNGAAYQCIVSNALGSVTSAPAKLTVKAPAAGPAIDAQPQDQVVVGGDPVSFSVSATGTGQLTYQWKKNSFDIQGATGAELDLGTTLTSDTGASFTVAVTDQSGTAISRRAMLTVMPADGAPIILANPARSRVLQNRHGSFSVKAWSASPMSYQWQKGPIAGNMADIPGATSSAYTTPLTTLADNLTLFRCVVSNDSGSVTSASELLFVTQAPTAPTEIISPRGAAAQVGAPFAYTIVSSDGTVPLTFSASPLPNGLAVDAASGLISGSPTATGTSSITMGASNGAGDISASLTLAVTDTPPAIALDAWRNANFGAGATNPAIAGDTADPDGDGYSNLDEFTFGSDPLNAASVPTALAAAPAAYDFGTVPAGSSGQATFTVSNTGAGTFSGSTSVGGAGFSVLSGVPFTIAPGGSTPVVIGYTPADRGAFSGQVTFSSSGGSAIASLTGRAIKSPPGLHRR